MEMLKFIRAIPENRDRWGAAVPVTDPHFSLDYYRAFGGGALAVLYKDNAPVMAQPFRYQGALWIGNAHNFGGAVGDPRYSEEFFSRFAEWKAKLDLNERCTICPVIDRNIPPWAVAQASEVVYVDLTQPTKLRQTTRHVVERWARRGLKVYRADRSDVFVTSFEGAYDRLMAAKDAASHWRYNKGFFAKVLAGLGPERSALFATVHDRAPVSYCFLIFDKDTCYYHWAARVSYTSPPDHFMVNAVIDWARVQGMKKLILGGGLESGDSLMRFKKGFSDLTLPCYRYVAHAVKSGVK